MLNMCKSQFVQESVKFCGYVISRDGVASDSEKVHAIADFHTQTNMIALCSFLGLMHHLDSFSTGVVSAPDPLRSLLKK